MRVTSITSISPIASLLNVAIAAATVATVAISLLFPHPASAQSAPAPAPSIRLDRGFKQPLLSPPLKARVDDTRVNDRGWKQCDPGGTAFTTARPLLTFEVTEPMPLRIRLENDSGSGDASGSGGVIVFPDGSYVCENNGGQFFMQSWPKGRYSLHLYGHAIGVGAMVRFEDPPRAERDLAAALTKLPTVTLGADGALNPRHEEVKPTIAVDAGDAGPTCGRGRQRLMPLARLDVRRESTWYVASGDAQLFVLTAGETCLDPTGAPTLPAGTHTLWTVLPIAGAAARYPLEIDDRAAALALAPAERRDAGALDAPLVIAGRVRAGERWYARSGACRGAARAPDFYLVSDRPLQKVTLSLLWSRAPQRLHVMGPLADVKPSSQPRCGEDRAGDEHRFDILEGTYAVWVGGDAAAAGTDYHVLVLRDGLSIDPMTSLAPIPEELSLADRAIKNHYPYFRGGPVTTWTPVWTTTPDRLLVYTRAAVDGTDVPAGEPLLVNWSQRDKTSAYRYDGSPISIDTRLISDTRPAQVVLPGKPTLPRVESLSSARDHAGPEDRAALAAYQKLDDKFSDCLFTYLRKHDPTFHKDHDVYRISGSKVVNVGDQIAAAGARKCGEKKLDAAGKNLEKQLARTRTARHVLHLAAVRKRFGL